MSFGKDTLFKKERKLENRFASIFKLRSVACIFHLKVNTLKML